ncbi:hypothetical protein OU798_12070 [Prolixibacteraceae bacterium Z1-6]|uniref:Uncharacterized protein n=1 Tax=Draconibacterium aestuarii TaxID=2998507 RepID=A0A9X3F5R8_9BACT|nr:hypothetical protein [Prolixibacteraceae bacterium Z1-6]
MNTKAKLFLVVAVIIGLAACNKTEEPIDNSIEGTYVGTLTVNGLKSASETMQGSTSATADVTKTGDGQIEVHCYNDDIDTTFMLNYFDNHDSIMVCLNGDDFEHMYGHMYGQGHMGGGMMGDITNGETEWQHHMDDEHKDGDEHFGGFDPMNHTFGYRFRMFEGDTSYMLNFQGSKSN